MTDLVALLDAKRQDIALAWAMAIRREMRNAFYGQRPLEEICDNNFRCLDVLKHLLLGGDALPSWWGSLPRLMSYTRKGHSVTDSLKAAGLCEQVLSPLVADAFPPDAASGLEAALRLDALVSKFVALVTGDVAVRITEYMEEQRRHTELMLGIARAVSTSLDLHTILRQAATGIASAAGAQHGWIGQAGEDGAARPAWAATENLPRQVAEDLALAAPRFGKSSLARRVIDERQVIIWPDVQSDPAVEDYVRAWGVRSALGVPCAINERILGAAFVATFDAPCSFTSEQTELALGIANVVAQAIENARLYDKVRQSAIVEERARLAREIHDDLAQTLGAIQLRASIAGELLAENRVAEAQTGVQALQVLVTAAYGGVRDAIFNLRAMGTPGAGFLSALQEYVSDYRAFYGLDVRLEADEDAAPALAGSAGVQASRIIQEALTNARKHSHATRTWVRVRREGACVRITVEDDGQGFEPANTPELGLHFGLHVMRERAEQVRGTLSVHSRPGLGTRVVLELPVRGDQGEA